MKICVFLRRAANVIGVLTSIGALVLAADFLVNLWAVYHGQPPPPSSSRLGG